MRNKCVMLIATKKVIEYSSVIQTVHIPRVQAPVYASKGWYRWFTHRYLFSAETPQTTLVCSYFYPDLRLLSPSDSEPFHGVIFSF